MRNQHLDSKTFSILSRILQLKILLIFGLLFVICSIPPLVFAEVFIPTDEYVGYFDSNGIYTVVGNVKNEFDHAIIPTISVSVIDDAEEFSKTIQHVPLASGTEIPFKIKFPEILGVNPILIPVEISLDLLHN